MDVNVLYRRRSVMMITPEYHPDKGGVADYTHSVVQGLSKFGVDLRTVVVNLRGLTAEGGITRHSNVERRSGGLHTWVSLVLSASKSNVRTVHLQYVPHAFARHGVAPVLVLFAILLRLTTRAELVVTMHELWIPAEAHAFRLAISLLQRVQTVALAVLSTVVIVTNERNKQGLERIPRRFRPVLRQIAAGSNVPVFKGFSPTAESILRYAPGSTLLAVFSPYTVGKSYLPLLDILEAVPETTLLCIGGLEMNDPRGAHGDLLSRMVLERGLTDRFLRTGYLPTAAISALLQKSTLYVHLQGRGASFGSTALAAAMEHGLPILGYDGLETAREFVNGKNIYLVPQEEPQLLIAAVRDLLRNEPLRKRLAENAHCLWRQHCSWERITEQNLACYS